MKKDGNLFVHLDWHASHYVKVLLDEVFGYENFRNEIVWCYTGPSKVKNDFPKKHDIILRYSKTKNPRFYPVRIPYKSGVHDTRGTAMNYKGRYIDVKELSDKGKVIEDWWTDIWAAERYRKEYLYFDTQKPIKLLERIIVSATKKGDLVGDFFMGSGSTIIASEMLGRKWVGCDNSPVSYTFVNKRLAILKKSKSSIGHFGTFVQTSHNQVSREKLGNGKYSTIKKEYSKEQNSSRNSERFAEESKLGANTELIVLEPLSEIRKYGQDKQVPRLFLHVSRDKENNELKISPTKYELPTELLEKIKIDNKNIDLKGLETSLLDYIKIGIVKDGQIYFSNLLYVDNPSTFNVGFSIPEFLKEVILVVEAGDLTGNVLIGYKKMD